MQAHSYRLGLGLLHIFLLVNKSHGKVRTDNDIDPTNKYHVCVSKLYYIIPLCHKAPLLPQNY